MRVELLEGERVHSIVGAFFAVFNYYGYGLSESVYAAVLPVCGLAEACVRVGGQVSTAGGRDWSR